MTFLESIKSVCLASYIGACLKRDILKPKSTEFYTAEFEGWWANNKEDVLRLCQTNVKGMKIVVAPVTPFYDIQTDQPTGQLAYGAYKGWTGSILAEAMTGTEPAYKVLISKDRVSYIRLTINKNDIKFLSDGE